jgi:hypothetical protein
MFIVRRRNSLRVYQNKARLRHQLEKDMTRELVCGPGNNRIIDAVVIEITESREIPVRQFLEEDE